jgi:hypothetical protein
MIIAAFLNVHRDTKKKPDPWMPEDFFPHLKPPAPPDTGVSWGKLFAFLKRVYRSQQKDK